MFICYITDCERVCACASAHAMVNIMVHKQHKHVNKHKRTRLKVIFVNSIIVHESVLRVMGIIYEHVCQQSISYI